MRCDGEIYLSCRFRDNAKEDKGEVVARIEAMPHGRHGVRHKGGGNFSPLIHTPVRTCATGKGKKEKGREH